MQTFYLDTILAFLKQQRQDGYCAIEAILDILEDDSNYPEDKKDAILFLLHKWGLNEVEHKKGQYAPWKTEKQGQDSKIIELSHGKYNQCLMTQMVTVNMLNGQILFEVCLN